MKKKAGIPLIAMIIFFALIIGVIITCIIILSSQKKKNSSGQINLANSSASITNNSTDDDNSVMKNAVVDNDDNDEEEPEELDIATDEDVKNLFIEAGNQKTFAKYAIYKLEKFGEDDISNDLKLKLAISQVDDSDIISEDGLHQISKDTVDDYIQKIFGSTFNMNYVDVELYNNDSNFLDYYDVEKYVYDEDGNLYELYERGINENEPPLINDVVEKALKYNDRIEIIVIPLFINTFETNDGMGYQLYKNYNFDTKEFGDKMSVESGEDFAVISDVFNQALKSDDSIDGYNYENLKDNIKDFDSLQRYKYIFRKDSNSGKYYLSGFEAVESNDEDNNNNYNNHNNYNNDEEDNENNN